MKFLVYTVEPKDRNATLDSFLQDSDKDISRIVNLLENMGVQRVLENETVNLWTDNINHNKNTGILSADIYKQSNYAKPLHQLAEYDDEEVTTEEIVSEHDDVFIKGKMGVRKVDNKLKAIVEADFGSYFAGAARGLQVRSDYSGETITAIQESETIGNTTLDFAEDYDLTASLLKPPEDADIREESGFGSVDLINKLTSLFNISNAHRMSLDIGRDEWLNNVDVFNELIESGIVTTVRIEDTRNGIVRLGEGGEKAIRRNLTTAGPERTAVRDAFRLMKDDS